jgi:hypothetical protein
MRSMSFVEGVGFPPEAHSQGTAGDGPPSGLESGEIEHATPPLAHRFLHMQTDFCGRSIGHSEERSARGYPLFTGMGGLLVDLYIPTVFVRKQAGSAVACALPTRGCAAAMFWNETDPPGWPRAVETAKINMALLCRGVFSVSTTLKR